jgi:hypothetical protein
MCHLPLLSGATIILALLAPAARAAELYAAFWNVENLFDTVDDQAVRGDEDFTPEGKKAWTEQRLQAKLGRLAGVVRRMNGGKGPDVLAVAEVENRRVVEMLSAELVASTATSPGRSYKVVHQDSPSERGIDVAILYDERKLELKGAKFHRVDAANTRDVVEAEFAVAGRPFHLLANHWPSRAHDASFRVRAARVVRKRLDELLAADAKADVLVVGDLNDHPADQSVADALGTSRTPAGATGRARRRKCASATRSSRRATPNKSRAPTARTPATNTTPPASPTTCRSAACWSTERRQGRVTPRSSRDRGEAGSHYPRSTVPLPIRGFAVRHHSHSSIAERTPHPATPRPATAADAVLFRG